MPTEYTNSIAAGATFEEFVQGCAVIQGAFKLVAGPEGTQVIAPFELNNYHAKELVKERAKLAELEALSITERAAGCAEYHRQAENDRQTSLNDMNALRDRYTTMRRKVVEWTPPSPNHEGIKMVMLSQIDQSITHDCTYTHYDQPVPVITPVEWLEQQKQSTLNNIEYHNKKNAEACRIYDQNNEWIRLLNESLQPKKGS